mgnify:CR=1 FL=1
MFFTAIDLVNILEISQASAYRIIRTLNYELEKEGFKIVTGKIPKKFFFEKYYVDRKDYDNVSLQR